MAVAVTNNTLTANTASSLTTTYTANAATADTDALAEVFTFTPTKEEGKLVLLFKGTGSGADGNITISIAAGGFSFGANAAKSITWTKNTTIALYLDSGQYISATGTIVVTLTPAATDKLKTDHAATVAMIELP